MTQQSGKLLGKDSWYIYCELRREWETGEVGVAVMTGWLGNERQESILWVEGEWQETEAEFQK